MFINFRGEDTRKTSVSHLYAALTNAGINTYIDGQLHKGTELGPQLVQAIQSCRIAILVFSKNYTQSSWCLNELLRTHAQVVVPVFYDVDPSVVRHQKGDFGDILRATARRVYSERLDDAEKEFKWRSALTRAADFSGWDVPNCRYLNQHLLLSCFFIDTFFF